MIEMIKTTSNLKIKDLYFAHNLFINIIVSVRNSSPVLSPDVYTEMLHGRHVKIRLNYDGNYSCPYTCTYTCDFKKKKKIIKIEGGRLYTYSVHNAYTAGSCII